MIKKYFSLVVALFLQMFLINTVFGQVKFDEEHETYETNKMIANVLELFLMLVVNLAIIYYVLKNDIDRLSLYFIIILSSFIILLFWIVYKTDYLANHISRVSYEMNNVSNNSNNTSNNNLNNNSNNISNNISNNNNTNVVTKKAFEGVAFSKYHNKDTNRDFTFEDSYPNYNEIEPSLENTNNSNSNSNNNDNSVPDYSMYNGYDENHICFNCKCLEEDDGSKFCAKDIPGIGRIGCSERWECLNCKDCQTWDDERFAQSESNDADLRYTCQDCKCLNTDAGVVCGKVSRADGYVQKCSSECKKCDKCYGRVSNNSNNNNSNNNSNTNGYVSVEPSSSLNKVIVNNLKNSDLDNAFN